jgi:hypothetical protein
VGDLRSAFAAALSAASSFMVGVLLIVAPWAPIWETNYLLQMHPLLRQIMLDPVTRGAVTGLGLVNLLLGALEVRAYWRGTKSRT